MDCSSSLTSASQEFSQDFQSIYALSKKIGKGAHAQVHLARRKRGSATDEVVVKLVDLGRREKARKSAYTEVCVWHHIGHHPNCVQMRENYFDDYLCYMVMERCSNTLASYLMELEELSERSLEEVFAQLLQGVSHIHSRRVMHRDIKPDNILVGGKDSRTVKLADFGVSKYVPQGCLDGKPVGSPAYMCPEMVQHGKYDLKADVWSCGVVAYLFLCGRFPYKSPDSSGEGMKTAIAQGGRPNCDKPWLSKKTTSFLAALLERDPQVRVSAELAIAMPFFTRDGETQAMRILPPQVKRTLLRELSEDSDLEQISPIDAILNFIDKSGSKTKTLSQLHVDEFLEAETDLKRVDKLVESFWAPVSIAKVTQDDGQSMKSTTCPSSSSSSPFATSRS